MGPISLTESMEVPVAYYSVYGVNGEENVDDGKVQLNITFIVAMAKTPEWMAWYKFYEKLDKESLAIFNQYYAEGKDFDASSVFGSQIAGGHPQTLEYSPFIKVNEFCGFPLNWDERGVSETDARLVLVNRKTVYDCMVTVFNPGNFERPTRADPVTFDFDLNHEADLIGSTDRWGILRLLGWRKFDKSLLPRGWPR